MQELPILVKEKAEMHSVRMNEFVSFSHKALCIIMNFAN